MLNEESALHPYFIKGRPQFVTFIFLVALNECFFRFFAKRQTWDCVFLIFCWKIYLKILASHQILKEPKFQVKLRSLLLRASRFKFFVKFRGYWKCTDKLLGYFQENRFSFCVICCNVVSCYQMNPLLVASFAELRIASVFHRRLENCMEWDCQPLFPIRSNRASAIQLFNNTVVEIWRVIDCAWLLTLFVSQEQRLN